MAAGQVRVFDLSFEDALEMERSPTKAEKRVDPFVAAGANGAYLRDHAPVPVALLNVSTPDALQALADARMLGRRIGVVNSRRVFPCLEHWKDLLRGVQIEQRAYVTTEEARAAVADLPAQGYEVVVGSGPACEVADVAGLKSVLLTRSNPSARPLSAPSRWRNWCAPSGSASNTSRTSSTTSTRP